MKIKVLVAMFMISFSGFISAQAPVVAHTPENAGWLTNLDEAYAKSKSSNKPILANFTGSDWCGWCKRLTASVFSQPDFKTWADKNVVLLELDFPRGKQLPDAIRQQNQSLQQAFGVGGYPTVWLFDLNKDNAKNQYSITGLGKTGYTPTVGEFITPLNSLISTRNANIKP
jgi:thiol:disulfide interchange protein